jgi:hypothetical protein
MATLIEIPYREVIVRRNGVDEKVLELTDFWRIVSDDGLDQGQVISNPLIIWHDILPAVPEGTVPQEKLYFRLTPSTKQPNPGTGDDGVDLTFDYYIL